MRIILKDKPKLRPAGYTDEMGSTLATGIRPTAAPTVRTKNFLRVPPFPGACVQSFSQLHGSTADIDKLSAQVVRFRIGGTFWAAQPALPASYILVRSVDALESVEQLYAGRAIVVWQPDARENGVAKPPIFRGECDPWHMLSSASAVVVESDDELRVIAALLDIPRHVFDPKTGELHLDDAEADALLLEALPQGPLGNPFTGEPMSVGEAVELCAFWRALIDSNREIAGGLGFAFWKRDHVAPLLWDGSARPFRFLKGPDNVPVGSHIAIWRAKTPPQAIARLVSRDVKLIEIEDGFLRSRGLGADCIPPLSITVDRIGAHFDPSCPSELETLLQNGRFDEPLLARARELRRRIVAAALGKYDRGAPPLERPACDKRYILVPGQVEDDRAVQAGGCGLVSNIELLKRVREQAPDAFIIYKPHPDVLAGHRRGGLSENHCLQHADRVDSNASIGSLLDLVDEVHVNTSLAGFEALIRGKPVTTYGVPFYAGWGLTRDLGPVPARRTAERTIDELVAAALLVYPRYLDPVTGLPCPAEVVVRRLSADESGDEGLVVGVRRLQGRLKRRIRRFV